MMHVKTLRQTAKMCAGVVVMGFALNSCSALRPGACTNGEYMDTGMNGASVEQAQSSAEEALEAAQRAEQAAEKAEKAAKQAKQSANKAENIIEQDMQK